MFCKLLLVNLILVSIGNSQNHTKQMNLKSFTPDPLCDKRFFNFGNLKIVKTAGEKPQLSGKVKLLQDMGNNVGINLQLFRDFPDGRSRTFSVQYWTACNDPVCDISLFPITVVPSYSRCPVRKGIYNVLNVTIHDGELMAMSEGNYHVEARILRDAVKICGAKLALEVVEKTPNKTPK